MDDQSKEEQLFVATHTHQSQHYLQFLTVLCAFLHVMGGAIRDCDGGQTEGETAHRNYSSLHAIVELLRHLGEVWPVYYVVFCGDEFSLTV